jgi:hypothetical protein
MKRDFSKIQCSALTVTAARTQISSASTTKVFCCCYAFWRHLVIVPLTIISLKNMIAISENPRQKNKL